jgi:hypothetical protein
MSGGNQPPATQTHPGPGWMVVQPWDCAGEAWMGVELRKVKTAIALATSRARAGLCIDVKQISLVMSIDVEEVSPRMARDAEPLDFCDESFPRSHECGGNGSENRLQPSRTLQ